VSGGPLSSGRRAVTVLGVIALAALAGTVVVLGFVGIPSAVSSGGQAQVCGLRIGVTVDGDRVHVAGIAGTHAEGERVRVAALCVVEIVDVEVTDLDPDEVGGGAAVDLRWRLW